MAAWRAHLGMTLQQVADASGLSKQTLSYVELGDQDDLGICKVNAVCTRAFKVDLVTFLGPIPGYSRSRQ